MSPDRGLWEMQFMREGVKTLRMEPSGGGLEREQMPWLIQLELAKQTGSFKSRFLAYIYI